MIIPAKRASSNYPWHQWPSSRWCPEACSGWASALSPSWMTMGVRCSRPHLPPRELPSLGMQAERSHPGRRTYQRWWDRRTSPAGRAGSRGRRGARSAPWPRLRSGRARARAPVTRGVCVAPSNRGSRFTRPRASVSAARREAGCSACLNRRRAGFWLARAGLNGEISTWPSRRGQRGRRRPRALCNSSTAARTGQGPRSTGDPTGGSGLSGPGWAASSSPMPGPRLLTCPRLAPSGQQLAMFNMLWSSDQ